MKNFSIILSTIAVILAAVALFSVCKCNGRAPIVAPSIKGGISQEQLASMLSENPKIIADALKAYEQYQREAEEKAAAELLAQNADKLNSEANVPFVGPKDAKVTVVEFFDFSCGYCKMLAPEIEKLVANNPDIKFVFKPVTFLGPNSVYMAKAAMAAKNQGKFLEMYKALMGDEGRPNEAQTDEYAKKIGLDMDKYKADLNSEEVANALKDVTEFSQKIRVNGVPSLFINAKQTHGRSVDELQNSINAAK